MAEPGIVIADGDPATRTAMQAVLEAGGYRVTAVATGTAAATLVRQGPPALLILDLRLGWVATDLGVRQAVLPDREARPIPVILSTTNGAWLAANGERMRARGYGVLPKPFDQSDLLALVDAMIGPGRPARRPASIAQPPSPVSEVMADHGDEGMAV